MTRGPGRPLTYDPAVFTALYIGPPPMGIAEIARRTGANERTVRYHIRADPRCQAERLRRTAEGHEGVVGDGRLKVS